MGVTEGQKKSFEYFLSHQDELAEKYPGKFIVIKDEKVIAVYDDEATAVVETEKQYPLGTFIVQKCEHGPDSYTCVFHSRMIPI